MTKKKVIAVSVLIGVGFLSLVWLSQRSSSGASTEVRGGQSDAATPPEDGGGQSDADALPEQGGDEPDAVSDNNPATATRGGAGSRRENITDPTLDDMTAFSVTIPANWNFQAVLLQGGVPTCESPAYPSWRASSPEGLSLVEQMPEMFWVWGTGPKPSRGCLPLDGPMSAQDFLKYISATMQLEFVADVPDPEDNARAQQQLQEANAKSTARGVPVPNNAVDVAEADVRYKNGTFDMQGRLHARLDCMERIFPASGNPPQWVDKCTALVNFTTAPGNQVAGLIHRWRTSGMGIQRNDDWAWTSIKRYAAQTKQQSDAMVAGSQASFSARQQAIQHSMAVGKQMHEQFMQTMQEGTDRSMVRAAEMANSDHRAAQDMVDYALNQQTVMDPETGGINKASSLATTVWSNGSGQMYQSTNPYANPNGVFAGNWSKQTVVHGDGSQ